MNLIKNHIIFELNFIQKAHDFLGASPSSKKIRPIPINKADTPKSDDPCNPDKPTDTKPTKPEEKPDTPTTNPNCKDVLSGIY
jgi:hypothetical protein